jgi:hypothetical protein
VLKSSERQPGGVALIWREDDQKFVVESVRFNYVSNIVTFQIVTGDEQFYIVGIYIPPNCMKGLTIYGRQGKHARRGINWLYWGI